MEGLVGEPPLLERRPRGVGGYGYPPLLPLIKTYLYFELLKKANEEIFNSYRHPTEEERELVRGLKPDLVLYDEHLELVPEANSTGRVTPALSGGLHVEQQAEEDGTRLPPPDVR